MPELVGSILDQVNLTTLVDIGITALLIYWLFSLIRGTRAVRLVIGVSVLFVVYVLAVAFDLRLLTQILQTRRRRRPVRARRRLPAGAPPRARADRPGRLVRLAPRPGRVARGRPRRRRGRAGRCGPVGRGPRRAHRPRARDRARGGRRDRRDDPRRRLSRPPPDDLRAADAAPRRRGDHPRRDDPRRRRAAAAGRDDDPHRALRDPPPGGPRDHRADRRGGRRRLRGERPGQPRRAGPDRPQPERAQLAQAIGAARPGRPGPDRRNAAGDRGPTPRLADRGASSARRPRRRAAAPPEARRRWPPPDDDAAARARGEATPRGRRPQLAPQARRDRSRHPAVRRTGRCRRPRSSSQRGRPGRSVEQPARRRVSSARWSRSPTIRYFAPNGRPADRRRPSRPRSISAGVDAGVPARQLVPIDVTSLDPRITVLD